MASRDCIACNRTQLAIRFRIKRVALRVLGSLRPFRLWRSAEAKAARARDRHPQALSAVVPISDARRVGLEYRTKPHRPGQLAQENYAQACNAPRGRKCSAALPHGSIDSMPPISRLAPTVNLLRLHMESLIQQC